jgi:glycosyltransferase involved in cell wall biosynthesis
MNPDYGNKLINVAARMVLPGEARVLVGILNAVLTPRSASATPPDVLGLVRIGSNSTAFNSLALYINRLSREISGSPSAATRAPLVRSTIRLREKLALVVSKAPVTAEDPANGHGSTHVAGHTLENAIVRTYQTSLGRSPVVEEIEIWKGHLANGLSFHEFFLSVGAGEEGRAHVQNQTELLSHISDGEFVQTAFELISGTGASAWEIESWQRLLREGSMTRPGVVTKLFVAAHAFVASQRNAPSHDGKSCLVMGTGVQVTATDWEGQAAAFRAKPPVIAADTRFANRFHIRGKQRVLVSAIASMYRGGEFIEQFMDNITSQDGFDDWMELVIVDADSPENEYETIKKYLGRHKNINYVRCNYRLGIYDAWNVGAKAARGDYLTNTNMDDLRRRDSLQMQAATLDSLPFVDVVYQDLFYTFDPRLSFIDITAFGLQTRLPVITPHNMIQFNSPHNAPMWRKRLHDELGYFDTNYQSAGDYEFWMRCLAAKKKFYKTNDPHVAYYQNPKGLSTRPGGRGLAEAMLVHKTYCRKLITEDVVMPLSAFRKKLDSTGVEAQENERSRYVLAQHALRDAARFCKYPVKREEA